MDIKYNLIRSKRKTVGITVSREKGVTVRAPQRLPVAEIERIIKKHSEWIVKKLNEQSLIKEEILTEEDERALAMIAEKVFFEKVRYYAELMGLAPNKVRIGFAKKRYGSCSSKGSISLSAYVILFPEAAQDLIIVHELCHLRHMNHSKDFYTLLSEYLPDHKERKKLLSPENRISMSAFKEKYHSV